MRGLNATQIDRVTTPRALENVEKAQGLPLEKQDQAARILLAYAGDEKPILALTPEEEADLREAQAEMPRGEFATEAEVEAVFAKYCL